MRGRRPLARPETPSVHRDLRPRTVPGAWPPDRGRGDGPRKRVERSSPRPPSAGGEASPGLGGSPGSGRAWTGQGRRGKHARAGARAFPGDRPVVPAARRGPPRQEPRGL